MTTIIQEVYHKKINAFSEEIQRKQKELNELTEKYNNCLEKIKVFSKPEKMLKIYHGNNIILCNIDEFGITQGKTLWLNGKITIYNQYCQTDKMHTNQATVNIFSIDDIIPLTEYEMKEELFKICM